jgi:putative endonuclease
VAWPFGRSKPLGQRGEDLARRFLRKAGLKVLGRDYRCPAGEVDLIALDRSTRKTLGAETIVFVEVKTRSAVEGTRPEAAVDGDKQARVRSAAAYYLAHYPTAGYRTRYDIVAVILPEDGKPQITHTPNAF